MKFDLASILSTGAKIADALAGSEDITIRHSGLTVKAPYEGNQEKTVREIINEYGPRVGIPNGSRPNVTRPGEGAVDIDEPVQPGTYDAFTDKKENA